MMLWPAPAPRSSGTPGIQESAQYQLSQQQTQPQSVAIPSSDPGNKQGDSLHKASHLIAHRLAERAVVIGDHALRQMVIPKKENQAPKEKTKRRIRNRMVYNNWGLYRFVQMLTYKCRRFAKELHIINKHDTIKRCHVCRNQPFEHVLKGR